MNYLDFFSKETCYWCGLSMNISKDKLESYCFNIGCKKYSYFDIPKHQEIVIKFSLDLLPVIHIHNNRTNIYITGDMINMPFDHAMFKDRSKLYHKVQTIINFS